MGRDLKYFWLISRPLNVFISLLAFAVSCYIALYQQSFSFLEEGRFWATAATIALIAASGYWINDVYDFRIDRINKPGRTVVNALLSSKKVLTAYFLVSLLVAAFSVIYFVIIYDFYPISFINILSIVLLFLYASWLKRVSVAGNLLIAFEISLVILLAGYLYHINLELMYTIAFAFQITLLREITKDLEDIRGDLSFKLQTLPIQIGIRATKRVLWVLYVLFFLSCYVPFIVNWVFESDFLWRYLVLSILLVQAPTIYLMLLLQRAQEPSDYRIQSNLLKAMIFTGILTLLYLG